MPSLSPRDLLSLADRGDTEEPLLRSLALLEVAAPEHSRREWEQAALGVRNVRLLEVWESTFGPLVRAWDQCPGCSERVDLEVNAFALRAVIGRLSDDQTYELSAEGFRLCFRLPTTADLVAASRCGNTSEATQVLVERCLVWVTVDGVEPESPDLPSAVLSALSAAMDAADPAADLRVMLTCPSCGREWVAGLDVAELLWAEVGAEGRRLLAEVHELAWAYGWSESEILALDAHRRQMYLELVAG